MVMYHIEGGLSGMGLNMVVYFSVGLSGMGYDIIG